MISDEERRRQKGMTEEKFLLLRIDSDTIFKAFGIDKHNVTKVEARRSAVSGEFVELIIQERTYEE